MHVHVDLLLTSPCSDLNLEPWTEPAGSICVCVVVVSALRGPNIMRPFYIVYCACTVILAGIFVNDKLSSVSLWRTLR